MQTLITLKNIVDFYESNRQQGHTTAAVKGAEKTDAYVITRNLSSAYNIQNQFGKSLKTISVSNLDTIKHSGRPVVFDNDTIYHLASEAVAEIETLKHRIDELESQVVKNEPYTVDITISSPSGRISGKIESTTTLETASTPCICFNVSIVVGLLHSLRNKKNINKKGNK